MQYILKRKPKRNLLKDLRPEIQSLSLVVRDFNEILFHHEKLGGKQRPEKQMQAFRDSLDFRNLHDLGHKGDWFTWSMRRTLSQKKDSIGCC